MTSTTDDDAAADDDTATKVEYGFWSLFVGACLNVAGDTILIITEEDRRPLLPRWHFFACLIGVVVGILYYVSAEAHGFLVNRRRSLVVWSMRWVGYIAFGLFVCSSTMAVMLDFGLSYHEELSKTCSIDELIESAEQLQTNLFNMLFLLGSIGLLGCYGTITIYILLGQCLLPCWSVVVTPLPVMVVHTLVLAWYQSLWIPLRSPALGVWIFATFVVTWWRISGRHKYDEIR